MYKFLFFLFLLALTTINTLKNDLTEDNLKGKVKTVNYYSTEKFNRKTKVINYNENGFIRSKIIFYYKNDSLLWKRKYDKNYTYYPNKKIKEIELLDSICKNYPYYTLESRSVKKFNQEGYTESDTYYLSGYGDNGNGQGNRVFDPYKDIETQHTCVYNKKENKEFWREHLAAEYFHCSWINTYDNKGEIIAYEMFIDEDDYFKYSKSTNYKNGLKIENIIKTTKNNDTIAKYISTYDAQNNLTECIKYDKNLKMTKDNFYYKYDKHSNWVSRIKYYNGNYIETNTRKISYY